MRSISPFTEQMKQFNTVYQIRRQFAKKIPKTIDQTFMKYFAHIDTAQECKHLFFFSFSIFNILPNASRGAAIGDTTSGRNSAGMRNRDFGDDDLERFSGT